MTSTEVHANKLCSHATTAAAAAAKNKRRARTHPRSTPSAASAGGGRPSRAPGPVSRTGCPNHPTPPPCSTCGGQAVTPCSAPGCVFRWVHAHTRLSPMGRKGWRSGAAGCVAGRQEEGRKGGGDEVVQQDAWRGDRKREGKGGAHGSMPGATKPGQAVGQKKHPTQAEVPTPRRMRKHRRCLPSQDPKSKVNPPPPPYTPTHRHTHANPHTLLIHHAHFSMSLAALKNAGG